METSAATRAAPQQQRSRDKYDRILAAAAALLDEQPYELTTTKDIAARAGVSVGSLYRFFVDKQAIVAALTAHWLDDFVAVMDRALAGPPDELTGLVDRLVDAYAAFWRDQPGFRQAWFGNIGAAVSPAAADHNDRELVDRLYAVLTTVYAMPGGPELRSRLVVAVSVTEHLLDRAFKRDPDGDPVVLAELKVLLHRYLGGPVRQQ